MELPDFPYHPDPIATGAIRPEPVLCACCGRERPMTYVGPVYAVADLRRRLCPWCIADGSAAAKFDAQFTDAVGDLPDAVIRRTPGFSGWQQETWLAHCGDGAAFLGEVGAREIEALPDARESLVEHLGDETLLAYLVPDGAISAFLFRCRRCRAHLAYADFS
ncbi:uncharacterized protein CbrC (UPF0167 family) [Actinoplanes octamycinicus]|uniref:Uncharacterized protein CbrC (UPF0167 family) n=1 Tax=Actinoplanes octamycinicus TaxID=135948 RepID=A0A7W7H446_9ACTN|nr:CbrC family protein [Actinoplanes octamycinicus]MBB4743532.1 uncharacterized protein CbrC (UPF0167 family) [Actinoplanes octamycinicus]GIE62482.1 UPF0167 protein [Actinoplanes octamycinicus]